MVNGSKCKSGFINKLYKSKGKIILFTNGQSNIFFNECILATSRLLHRYTLSFYSNVLENS